MFAGLSQETFVKWIILDGSPKMVYTFGISLIHFPLSLVVVLYSIVLNTPHIVFVSEEMRDYMEQNKGQNNPTFFNWTYMSLVCL